jgi:hypothetical protein
MGHQLLPTITTDSGVTRTIGSYYTDDPPVSYPPGGSYTYYPFDNDGYPLYDVTGTLVAVPEPGTGAVLTVALGLIFFRLKARINRADPAFSARSK